MNTAHRLLIIFTAFIFTGCISSQALYFHERTKFGFSVQVKPEDPQEKIGTHIGFKRRIVAIVPPKMLSQDTRNAIDDFNGENKSTESPKLASDMYHEGEALSLVSTFDVTANALKSVHIHNNFASGQAAKNLVDVSNETYQASKNVKAFKEFIEAKKVEAQLAQRANSSPVAPVHNKEIAPPAISSGTKEAEYHKPYLQGHQIVLAKGTITYEDEFAQLTPDAKTKNMCIAELEDAGKDCGLTWLGELAKNKKMDFIEELTFIKNAKGENRDTCLRDVRDRAKLCGETLLTELAMRHETKIRTGLEKIVQGIRDTKKKAISELLKHLEQTDDTIFPLNILKEIGAGLVGIFIDATDTYTPEEITTCTKDMDSCKHPKLKEMLLNKG